MAEALHALDFLDQTGKHKLPGFVVVFGDEGFLRGLALQAIRRELFGAEAGDTPFSQTEGDETEWRDIKDELSTMSLFGGGRRLVIVDEADDFISKHREQLEDYAAKPASSAMLVLVADSWPSNTRLYKAVAATGLAIECRVPEKSRGKSKTPDEARVRQWLVSRAKQHHQAMLASEAATMLVELAGTDFGMLEQGLAKLALFAGIGGKITADMVRDIVGGWQVKSVWELLDLATDGNTSEALLQLDRVLQTGEAPQALFAQFSWSLRRFAAATRIIQRGERTGQRVQIRDALQQAGFRPWPQEALGNAERQLRQLGRGRAGNLYRWLLDADLALKGSHSQVDRARIVLERLIVKMAKQASAASK